MVNVIEIQCKLLLNCINLNNDCVQSLMLLSYQTFRMSFKANFQFSTKIKVNFSLEFVKHLLAT